MAVVDRGDKNQWIDIGKDPSGVPISVLVADESFTDRHMLTMSLNSWGFSVVGEASDGLETLDKFARLNPRLLVINVELPKIDGLSILQRLMKLKKPPVVVMVSSKSTESKVRRLLSEGAADFCLKPLDRKRLLLKVPALVKKHFHTV